MNVRRSKQFWGGALCGLLFLMLGCLFVSYAGLQEDESMFAAPLFREWSFYSIPFGGRNIPIMQMSYVGSLKTWLYTPFIHTWTPGPAVLRIPAVLIGAATILLFGALLERVHGRRAAWTGCVLLATDTIFLLTTTFDWGPVALQHLLMTAAMLFAVLWFQKSGDAWLTAAAFCCGLAFWDKAVFVWMFSGLLVGSLLFVARVGKRLARRLAVLSAAALCLGAFPLLVYNVASSPKFATIRSNSEFAPDHFSGKLDMLRRAWNGSRLFGYLVYDSAEHPALPHTVLEKASFAIHDITGDRSTNASALALMFGIVLLLPLWRTRARDTLLFSLIVCGFAWILMALSGGGTSVHHAVLLWPLPHLFLAVAFAEASLHIRFGGWALAAVLVFLAAANLAVTNQYLFQFVRNGSAGSWSDAIYALAAGMRDTPASQVASIDWGVEAPLSILNRDHPTVRMVADSFLSTSETPSERQADLQLLSDDRTIWVEHTPGNEMLIGVNDRVLNAASGAGFVQTMLGIYRDRNGKPVFQTFRFVAR
jgi:hypothetical protein